MQQRVGLMVVTLAAQGTSPSEIAVRLQASAVTRPHKRTWYEMAVRRLLWAAKTKESRHRASDAA